MRSLPPPPEEAVTSVVRGDVAALVIDNPPVNVLSHCVRLGLARQLEQSIADPAVRTIAILGAGRSFPAGADIREFDAPLARPNLTELHAIIEASTKPVVAVMHGTALGGGLELALACHRRAARKGASLGLPEIKLGLFPAGGGTQRVARLAGPEAALEIMLSARQIDAHEALHLGLVDDVFEGEPLDWAFGPKMSARLRRVRDLPCPPLPPRKLAATRRRLDQRYHGQIAPFAILECVELATRMTFDDAWQAERPLAKRCLESPQHKALKHLFFAEREATRLPSPKPDGDLAPGNVISFLPQAHPFGERPLQSAGLLPGKSGPLSERDGQTEQPTLELRKTLHAGEVECIGKGSAFRLVPLRPYEKTRLLEVILPKAFDAVTAWRTANLVRRLGYRAVFAHSESIARRLRSALTREVERLARAGSRRKTVVAAAVFHGFDRDLLEPGLGPAPQAISPETADKIMQGDLVGQLLSSLDREAALLLDERVAVRSGDIDVVAAAATGFPRHLGGPAYRLTNTA